MRRQKLFFSLFLVWIFCSGLHAQPVLEWSRLLTPSIGSSYYYPPTQISVDASGNSYIAADSLPTYSKLFQVAKYDITGIVQWIVDVGSLTDTLLLVNCFADSVGNVFITANKWSYPTPAFKAYVFKLSSQGSLDWIDTISNYVLSEKIISDNGSVYVSGYNNDSTKLLCYNSNGLQQVIFTYGERINGLKAIDNSGNFIFADIVNINYSLTLHIVRFSASGNYQWTANYDYMSNGVYYLKVITDELNNIIATGSYEFDNYTENMYLIKFDANGNLVFSTSLSYAQGWNVLVDANENIYVAGVLVDAYISPLNWFAIQYSPSGNQNWSYTGPDSVSAAWLGGQYFRNSSLLIDQWGKLYLGITTFQDSAISYSFYKMDTLGNLIWKHFESESALSYDLFSDMKLDASGNIYATGFATMFAAISIWTLKLSQPDFPTAIKNPGTNYSVVISPNPSTGVFEIRNSSSPIQNAEAFNLLGEKVFSTSNFIPVKSGQASKSIDLSSQPDGVYFLNLKTEEGMVVKKVVISH